MDMLLLIKQHFVKFWRFPQNFWSPCWRTSFAFQTITIVNLRRARKMTVWRQVMFWQRLGLRFFFFVMHLSVFSTAPSLGFREARKCKTWGIETRLGSGIFEPDLALRAANDVRIWKGNLLGKFKAKDQMRKGRLRGKRGRWWPRRWWSWSSTICIQKCANQNMYR
jgi:hypothetical protein